MRAMYKVGDNVRICSTKDYEQMQEVGQDGMRNWKISSGSVSETETFAELPEEVHEVLGGETRKVLNVSRIGDRYRYIVDYVTGTEWICAWNIKGLEKVTIGVLYD